MKISIAPVVRSVIGGLLIHLVLGNLYSWGIITTAVTAHLRKFNPSLTYNDTIMVYVTQLAFVGVNMGVGGIMQTKFGCKFTSLFGGSLVALGAFLAAFCKSLNALIFTYGVLFGTGVGIGYSAPIVCSTKLLPERKALIAGIVLSGFGGGAFVFGLLATLILHWNSRDGDDSLVGGYFSSDSNIASSVPTMFLILSAGYFTFVVVGAILLVEERDSMNAQHKLLSSTEMVTMNPVINESDDGINIGAGTSSSLATRNSSSKLPVTTYDRVPSIEMTTSISNIDDISRHFGDFDENVATSSLGSSTSDAIVDIGPSAVMLDSIGWHITSCYALSAVAGIFITGTYKTYGLKLFHDDTSLSVLGSVASLFSVMGRITWGAVADRIGITNTLGYLSFVFALLLFSYSYSPNIAGQATFALWTFCIFFVEGGIFSLFLPLTVQLFGSHNAGGNYGLFFLGFSMCNTFNVWIMSVLNVNFEIATVTMGAITFLGFLDIILLKFHIRNRFGVLK